MLLSSPPRRGCFSLIRRGDLHQRVFPASAGVFPHMGALDQVPRGLPRLGGGVSMARSSQRPVIKSSPPRRGCFLVINQIAAQAFVFPASAGVFPANGSVISLRLRLPRLGGGVSEAAECVVDDVTSSPPRRGCFFDAQILNLINGVFPALAGVFPRRCWYSMSLTPIPRHDGGVSFDDHIIHNVLLIL